MKHKYLSELQGDGNSYYPYKEPDYPIEDEEFGFDVRETFSLDGFMITWLYERLRFFQDEASKRIDLGFHKFKIHDEELTQAECIERMVNYCKIYLEEFEPEDYPDGETLIEMEEMQHTAVKELFYILGEVFPAMWW